MPLQALCCLRPKHSTIKCTLVYSIALALYFVLDCPIYPLCMAHTRADKGLYFRGYNYPAYAL